MTKARPFFSVHLQKKRLSRKSAFLYSAFWSHHFAKWCDHFSLNTASGWIKYISNYIEYSVRIFLENISRSLVHIISFWNSVQSRQGNYCNHREKRKGRRFAHVENLKKSTDAIYPNLYVFIILTFRNLEYHNLYSDEIIWDLILLKNWSFFTKMSTWQFPLWTEVLNHVNANRISRFYRKKTQTS